MEIEFDTTAPVDSLQWQILRPFMHDGITYGRNEPLPATIEGLELLGLLRIGVVVHRKSDGSLTRPSLPRPDSPAAYLRLSDTQVLRAVREHPPTPEDLAEIAWLAHRNRRSALLIEALDALSRAPISTGPRQPVGDADRLHADLQMAVNSLEEERQHHAQLRAEYATLQQTHADLVMSLLPPAP